MEQWDFLGCSCDLSLPDGQHLLEDYLKELSNSTTTAMTTPDLNQYPDQNAFQDHEDSESPLSKFNSPVLGAPPRESSDAAAAVTTRHTHRTVDGVSRELFANGDVCEDGIESKLASLSVNDGEAKKDSDFSKIVDSLAELLDKNLSFSEQVEEETDFHPSTLDPAPIVSPKPVFLAG